MCVAYSPYKTTAIPSPLPLLPPPPFIILSLLHGGPSLFPGVFLISPNSSFFCHLPPNQRPKRPPLADRPTLARVRTRT